MKKEKISSQASIFLNSIVDSKTARFILWMRRNFRIRKRFMDSQCLHKMKLVQVAQQVQVIFLKNKLRVKVVMCYMRMFIMYILVSMVREMKTQ